MTREKGKRMRFRRWILLILGLGLFVYLIYQVGWPSILGEILKLKWNFLILLGVYAAVYVLDTLGWRFGFGSGMCRVNFRRLFWVRVAGEAVNNTTPTGYMGGEPVKALLLKQHGISMSESLASLVVAKTTLTLSEILFILVGLGVAFARLEIPSAIRTGMMVSLGLLTVLVLVFLFFQGKGLFTGIAKGLARFNVARKILMEKMERIQELESHLSNFYRKSKRRFLLSFLFHFLGWMAGILEVYLILKFLGIPLGFLDAFIIEALHQLVRGLAFVVPANLGTQEGGNLFIFGLLGFGAVLGLSVSLIRRIRELAWSGIGWGILLGAQKLKVKRQN